MCVFVLLLLFLTLCNPMDDSGPGSSVYGGFPGILEWIAIYRRQMD